MNSEKFEKKKKTVIKIKPIIPWREIQFVSSLVIKILFSS